MQDEEIVKFVERLDKRQIRNIRQFITNCRRAGGHAKIWDVRANPLQTFISMECDLGHTHVKYTSSFDREADWLAEATTIAKNDDEYVSDIAREYKENAMTVCIPKIDPEKNTIEVSCETWKADEFEVFDSARITIDKSQPYVKDNADKLLHYLNLKEVT